jgi:hypothetical protein
MLRIDSLARDRSGSIVVMMFVFVFAPSLERAGNGNRAQAWSR